MELCVQYLSKTNLSFFGIQLRYKQGREASSQLNKQAQCVVLYGIFFSNYDYKITVQGSSNLIRINQKLYQGGQRRMLISFS